MDRYFICHDPLSYKVHRINNSLAEDSILDKSILLAFVSSNIFKIHYIFDLKEMLAHTIYEWSIQECVQFKPNKTKKCTFLH